MLWCDVSLPIDSRGSPIDRQDFERDFEKIQRLVLADQRQHETDPAVAIGESGEMTSRAGIWILKSARSLSVRRTIFRSLMCVTIRDPESPPKSGLSRAADTPEDVVQYNEKQTDQSSGNRADGWKDFARCHSAFLGPSLG